MPMGGAMRWVPFDADWWPVVVASIPKPWPIELVYFDLRWWSEDGRTRPGRPALTKRWGVSERIARNALLAESVWGNPLKGPASVQPRSSEGPAKVQPPEGQTPIMDEKCPAEVQPRSSEGPANVPTRVEDQRKRKSKKEKTYTSGPEADRLVKLYAELAGQPDRTYAEPAKHIPRLLAKGVSPEDVELVTRWLFSAHDRAVYLRSKGSHLGNTPWRDYGTDPKWPMYLDMARASLAPSGASAPVTVQATAGSDWEPFMAAIRQLPGRGAPDLLERIDKLPARPLAWCRETHRSVIAFRQTLTDAFSEKKHRWNYEEWVKRQ